MPFDNLNDVIRRHDVTVYPYTADEQVGDSVYVGDDFGAPITVTGSIRPDSNTPRQYSVDELGQNDRGGERLLFNVPAEHDDDVTIDDSVDYKGEAWRVTERQHASLAGFSRYLLVPDNRRVADGSTA